MFSADLKRGSMELLILAVLERGTRHGYDIGKALERRSGGKLELGASTLYSALYRMEDRGLIRGRWVEREGERRRCLYRLTQDGQAALEAQRREWRAFARVVEEIISPSPA
ncbi:MAG: helix-turn-helix transcriptional regulator [Gemmatimonadota bacterium]|jgi:DNA-binding PadR family transcriptional regulator